MCTIHSLLALEERTNDVNLGTAVEWQERLISRSACVVVLSRAERAQYAALGYERLNRCVRVIHNGVHPPPHFRAPRGKRVLGYCGRLVPRKHPEYVQMMLNEPGFEDCRVLIAGRGFSPYARDHCASAAWTSACNFLAGAPVSDGGILRRNRRAGRAIKDEPFGLVAVEAAARGVPVVCTAVDGLIEVLGEHAFYCADTTFASFRTAMQAWRAATPEELASRCRAARTRYRRRFTDRIMCRRYGRLFREVAITR